MPEGGPQTDVMTLELIDHFGADRWWRPPFDREVAYEREDWWNKPIRRGGAWYVQVLEGDAEVARVELDDLGGIGSDYVGGCRSWAVSGWRSSSLRWLGRPVAVVSAKRWCTLWRIGTRIGGSSCTAMQTVSGGVRWSGIGSIPHGGVRRCSFSRPGGGEPSSRSPFPSWGGPPLPPPRAWGGVRVSGVCGGLARLLRGGLGTGFGAWSQQVNASLLVR